MVHQEQITFETTDHRQMDDLTDKVAAIVEGSGVKTGVVQVFCVGSTAAAGAIEFEPGPRRPPTRSARNAGSPDSAQPQLRP